MAGTLYKVYIHIIFSTLEGYNTIPQEALEKLHGYIAKVFYNLKCHDVCVGGISNHVHILTSMPKDMTIPQVVKTIKLATNKMLSSKYKLEKFEWQKGYAAFSVNPAVISKVKKYIKNQKEHHIQTSIEKEMQKLEILCRALGQ